MITPPHIIEFLFRHCPAATWAVFGGESALVAESQFGDVFWLYCPAGGPVNLGLLQEVRLDPPGEPLVEQPSPNAELLARDTRPACQMNPEE
jgi:hypothetical protein